MNPQKFFKYAIPLITFVAVVIHILLVISGTGQNFGNTLLLVVNIAAFIPLLIKIVKDLFKGNVGVDILALASIFGSILLGENLAGSVVVLMLSGGELLEELALKRSRIELNRLVSALPVSVLLKDGTALNEIQVSGIQLGMELIVRPGETVAVDGRVSGANAELDESPITGESNPVTKITGDEVFSGSVNTSSPFTMRVGKLPQDSKYQQIVELVRKAESQKAPFVRLADRYGVGFTILAFVLAIIAYLISGDPVRALSVLVVATPCPLILATPISFASGISISARRGIIVKSGGALEQLARVNSVVFDKTGTLTYGKPELEKLELAANSTKTEPEIWQIIAALESYSNHVIGSSIYKAAREKVSEMITLIKVSETFGFGISGQLNDGSLVKIGSLPWLVKNGIAIDKKLESAARLAQDKGKIVVGVSVDKQQIAQIICQDQLKPESRATIFKMRKLVGEDIHLLSGDKEVIVKKVAEKFDIRSFAGEQSPEQKSSRIEQLQKEGKQVLMIGDGVNDAPALVGADVGIALGYLGSNASTDSADIVITVSDLSRVNEAVVISKGVLNNAKQGIFIGIGLSSVLMLMGTLGLLLPLVGALLQEVIDLIVIINALRTRSLKSTT